MYYPEVITAPTVEPVSVLALRSHVALDTNAADDLLEAYEIAARRYVEYRTGRTLYETTLEIVFDKFPSSSHCPLVLPRAAPLRSVTWVRYTDSDGTVTTWAAANYIVNTDAQPGFVLPDYGLTYPTFTAQPTGAVRVRYIAGLDPTASPLVEPPLELQQAIKLLAGHLYINREAELIPDRSGVEAISFKYGVEALIGAAARSFPF